MSWYNSYQWWYSRIGGRKWTWIIRDWWHKAEFVWIVGLVCLGVYMGHHLDWTTVLMVIVIWSIGFLMGHVFWGTKYIEGQENGEIHR